jgi:two-component system, cell cycle sensor histidine kinase and response regulator CckA
MNTNKLRILVVDDDEDDFLLVRDLLQSTAEMDHAATPERALAAMEGRPYDLMLFDYLLGAQTGLDLLKTVRQRGVQAPIIFLTGRGDEEVAVDALKSGACDYLIKSKLTESALSRAVLYAVRIHRDSKLLQEAQEKLRASEEKFRALIENISDTVTVLDGAGVVRYANGSGALGYAETENIGRSGFELLHPEDLDRVRQLYLDCVRSPQGRAEAEFRVLHKDGSWRDVEATAVNHLAHPAIGGIIVSYHDITERKRAEQALRLSDEIVRHAGAVIVATNARGEVVYASDDSLKNVLGYELCDVLGELWWEKTYFDPQDAAAIRTRLVNALRDDSARPIAPFTRRVRHKGGSARWMLWNESKAPEGLMIGIGHDITALKETESALQSANEQLSMLLDSLPVAVYRADAETNATTFISGQVRQISGYRAKEFLHPGFWFDHIHPDDAAVAQQAIARTLEYGACTHEYRFLCADGAYRWMLDSARLVRAESGEPEYVVGTWLQIDDRKRAEEALRLQSTALEAAANAIVITDRDGKVVWVNPAHSRMMGWEPAEIIGATAQMFQPLEGDNEARSKLRDAVMAGSVWHGELRLQRKDESRLVADVMVTPLRHHDGTICNFIAVKQDITEQHRLRDRLAQAQKMEAVGRLSGGVAHDFNNILGVILGYAELLAEKIPEFDPLHRQVEEIHRAGRRAASLTRQLLAFSRQQVLQPVVLNLNSAVSEMERMLHRLIGEDIEITIVLTPDLASTIADRSQIEQIVMNLALNARDAMPMGGRLSIETANCVLDELYAQQHGDVTPGPYVMLAVTDTGIGMPRDVQAHVFEPFFTTKEAGKGTGLGLATVYGIVQQSGGHIWIYSEPGKGSTFKIYLPAVEAAAEPREPKDERSETRGTERILLVEDSQPLRELTCDLLRSCGYDVLASEDPREALALGRDLRKPIDLLITDVVMPGMNGPQLAEALQSCRPEMQVLYISGYTDHAVLTNGQLAGDAAFLQKPFTRQALSRKVREVLSAAPAPSMAK